MAKSFEIAVLPLQNTTLFPETVVPLAVGRERSTKAVEAALATEEKLLACITTKTENVTGDDAKPTDLYKIGTIVNIKRMMRNEGMMQLIVQGMDRFEILEWTGEQPYLKAKSADPARASPRRRRRDRGPQTQYPGNDPGGACPSAAGSA